MKWKVEKETYSGVSDSRLSIEVTTQCNNVCLHCFARARNSKHYSLSVDLVKEIITEGYNAAYRHLHITGGEPLLWKGLFVTLDHAFDIGYKTVFMNTNGTLLTDDVNNRLGYYDNLAISVSLEGSESLHDRLRGKGSYGQTVRGIEKAFDTGIELAIFTIVLKSFLPKLPYYVDDLYKKFPNISYLTLIQLIRVTHDAFVLSEELLDPEDFLKLVQTVSFLNLNGLKTNVLNDPLVNVVAKVIGMPWIPQSQSLN